MSGDRLSSETSPYLRMHAEDPVPWLPWGEEAFALARAEDRPIFLSSGYASCHWCHVMQADSFRDPVTADFLGSRFVPVKLDRESRPDVDAVYMDYVVATMGSGGWPLSVFLTPDLVPFFGGTFFPRQGGPGSPSFMHVLTSVAQAWADDRDQIREVHDGSLRFLATQSSRRPDGPIDRAFVDSAAEIAIHHVDQRHGGFGSAPKFPQLPAVRFLLAHHETTGETETLFQALRALRAMLRGGIYDQAGGGLFRYATDEDWLVPHFEKMLYDNGLLLQVLGHAHRLAPDPEFAHAIRRTAAFLGRELAAGAGAFASSLSADTSGVEGATYTWHFRELAELLSPDELDLAEERLDVSEHGNWLGLNILTRREGRGHDAPAVDALLDRLLALRGERPQPDVDTKVLASWNGLAARGLIEAGAAIGDESVTAQGIAALEAVLAMVEERGELVHVLDDPSPGVRLVEDHASVAAACLSAADVAGVSGMLDRARELHSTTLELFEERGTIHMTTADTDLPIRPIEQHESPTPSGAGLTVENALRLARHGERETHLATAREGLRQWWALADLSPLSAGQALTAALMLLTEEDRR